MSPMRLASGHTAAHVDGDEWRRFERHFPGYKDGLVRLSPGNWLMPQRYMEFADRLYNFKFCESDVMVMTWPNVGSSWMQEILWTMRNNPNLDHPRQNDPIFARAPFLEGDVLAPPLPNAALVRDQPSYSVFKQMCSGADPSKGIMIQVAGAVPYPRTFKTHLPFSLLPQELLDTCKVVYMVRNPKDTCVSYHHHQKLFRSHNFSGDMQDFVDHFVADELVYAPYHGHLKEMWEKRRHPNLHLVFYEDLKNDFMGELQKLNQFLGTNLNKEQLQNVMRMASFDTMQKSEKAGTFYTKKMMDNDAIVNQSYMRSEGAFFRQGKTGDWRKKLSPGQVEQMDRWTNEQCRFGINFKQ